MNRGSSRKHQMLRNAVWFYSFKIGLHYPEIRGINGTFQGQIEETDPQNHMTLLR